MLFGDNESVLNKASVCHSRLFKQHNVVFYHSTKNAIATKILWFHHISSTSNPADILSKQWGLLAIWDSLNPMLFWKADVAALLKVDRRMIDEVHGNLNSQHELIEGSVTGEDFTHKDRIQSLSGSMHSAWITCEKGWRNPFEPTSDNSSTWESPWWQQGPTTNEMGSGGLTVHWLSADVTTDKDAHVSWICTPPSREKVKNNTTKDGRDCCLFHKKKKTPKHANIR